MSKLICYKPDNRYAITEIDTNNTTVDGTIINQYFFVDNDNVWKDQNGSPAVKNTDEFGQMVQQYTLLKNRLLSNSLVVDNIHCIKGAGDVVKGKVESGIIKPLMRASFFDQCGKRTAYGNLPALSCNPLEQSFYEAGYPTCNKEIALVVEFADDSRPNIGDFMICE
jgi:hypothetical protein